MDPDSRQIETAAVAVLPDVTRSGLSKGHCELNKKKSSPSLSGKSQYEDVIGVARGKNVDS